MAAKAFDRREEQQKENRRQDEQNENSLASVQPHKMVLGKIELICNFLIRAVSNLSECHTEPKIGRWVKIFEKAVYIFE
jgi:hypothetical protein